MKIKNMSSNRKKINVLIFASIGSQNLGDELILKNEIKILKYNYTKEFKILEDNIYFTVFSYDKENNFYSDKNIKYLEYFPIGIKKIKNLYRNIKNFILFSKEVIKSDIIIIGGGGIFFDYENNKKSKSLLQWNFRTNFFRFFKKRVEFFRVGINIKKDKNLFLVSNIFSGAKFISVRDEYSFNLLKKLGFKSRLSLELDPVFFDKLDDIDDYKKYSSNLFKQKFLKEYFDIKDFDLEKILELQKNKKINKILKGEKVGFSLRKVDIDNYEKNFLKIINFFLEQKAEIVLIPHSFHKIDKESNDFIFLENIKNKINSDKISICKNMKESYKIYVKKKIDFNFASRLHSIILSQVYEIPFIGLSYSTKTNEVLKKLK